MLSTDKFDFMSIVQDIYDECKTKEEIASRMKEMMECIKQKGFLAMNYIDAGIL